MPNSSALRKKESTLDDEESPVTIHLTSGLCGIIRTEEAKESCFSRNNGKSPKRKEQLLRECKRDKHCTTRNNKAGKEMCTDNLLGVTCLEDWSIPRDGVCSYRTAACNISNVDGSRRMKETEYETLSRNSVEKTGFRYSNRYEQRKTSDVFRKIHAGSFWPKKVGEWEEYHADVCDYHGTSEDKVYTRQLRESRSSKRESSYPTNEKHSATVSRHVPILSSKLKVPRHSREENVLLERAKLCNCPGSKRSACYRGNSEGEKFDPTYKLYNQGNKSKVYRETEPVSEGETSMRNEPRASVYYQADIPEDEHYIQQTGKSRSSTKGSLHSRSRKRTTAIVSQTPSCDSRIEVPSISDIFQNKIASIHYRRRPRIGLGTKYVNTVEFQKDEKTSEGHVIKKRKIWRHSESGSEELDTEYTHNKTNRPVESERDSDDVEPELTKHSVEMSFRKRKKPLYTNTVSILISPAADKRESPFLNTLSIPVEKISNKEILDKDDLDDGLMDTERIGKNHESYITEAYFTQDMEQILRMLTNTTLGSMEWSGAKHSVAIQELFPGNEIEKLRISNNESSHLLNMYRTSITYDIATDKIGKESDSQTKFLTVPHQDVFGQISSTSRTFVEYVDESRDGKKSQRIFNISGNLGEKFDKLVEPVVKLSRKKSRHRLMHDTDREPSEERSTEKDLRAEKVPDSSLSKRGRKRVSMEVRLYSEFEGKSVSGKIGKIEKLQSSKKISQETAAEFESSNQKSSVHDSLLLQKRTYSESFQHKNYSEVQKFQISEELGFISSSVLGSVPFSTHSDVLLTVLNFSKQIQANSSRANPWRGKYNSSPNILQNDNSVSLKRYTWKSRFQIHSAYWRRNLLNKMLRSKSRKPYQNYLGQESHVPLSLERTDSSVLSAEDKKREDFTERFRIYVKQFLPRGIEVNGSQVVEEKFQEVSLRTNTLTQNGSLSSADLANKAIKTEVIPSKAASTLSESYKDQAIRGKAFTEDNLNALGEVGSGPSFDKNTILKLRTNADHSISAVTNGSDLKRGRLAESKHERADRDVEISHAESNIYNASPAEEILPRYDEKFSEADLPALIHMYKSEEEKDEPSEKEKHDSHEKEVFSTVERMLDEVTRNSKEQSQVQRSFRGSLSREVSEKEPFKKHSAEQDENRKDEMVDPEVFAHPHRRHTWHEETSKKLDWVSQPVKFVSDFNYRQRSDDNDLYSFSDSTRQSYGFDDNAWTLDTRETDLNQRTNKNKNSLVYRERKMPERRKEKFRDTSVKLKDQLGGLKSEGFKYLDHEKFSTLKKR